MASMFDYLKNNLKGKQGRVSGKQDRPRYDRAMKELKMKLNSQKIIKGEQRNYYRYLQDNPYKRYNSRA